MRHMISILVVIGSGVIGALFGSNLNRQVSSTNTPKTDHGSVAIVAENEALQSRLNDEKKWRSMAESQLLKLQAASNDTAIPGNAPVPAGEEPADVAVQPVAPRVEIEERIASQDRDPEWQDAVVAGINEVFASYSGSEVIDARCSSEICSVGFSIAGNRDDVSTIMDRMSAMREVKGERMIEVDDSRNPALGIAYFSRDGSISLSHHEVAEH